MEFKGRSFYNLLRINLKEDPSLRAEPWQVADYRILSVEEILERLQALGVSLTKEAFFLYAESCESPEDLLECLWLDDDNEEGQEKVYLLLFELWRRWATDKRSLSVFCDELDEQIFLYDEGQLLDEEPLQKSLNMLEDLLDQGVDEGVPPQEIFKMISFYLAHDIEEFLYDYILDQIEKENEVYASELIDGMISYVAEKKWFDLLRARLFLLSNSPETSMLIARILEQAEDESDAEFLVELAHFLAFSGEDVSLFDECVRKTLPLLDTEEALIELAELVAAVALSLDQEALARRITEWIHHREKLSLISPGDREHVETFLSQLV
jgi:hypothetical protein